MQLRKLLTLVACPLLTFACRSFSTRFPTEMSPAMVAIKRSLGPLCRSAFGIFLAAAVPGFATAQEARDPALIPQPVKVNLESGQFTITPTTGILYTKGDARLKDAADYLAGRLSLAFDKTVTVASTDAVGAVPGAIVMTTASADGRLGDEGYSLTVTDKGILIRAPKAAGVFYGGITLLQLAPPTAFRSPAMVEGKLGGKQTAVPPRPADEPNFSTAKPVDQLPVPCATVEDRPRFSWRGLLIDPARHYWTIEELKQYADYLALHKMNKMQIHFTDHQNWTVEVMKYPQLTPEKALNKADPDRLKNQTYHDKARHYYTQDELKSLVVFAKKRFVEIVPEFEMPGHAGALLRHMPEVGCTVGTKRRIVSGTLCPGQEETYTILQSILDEMLEIFPDKHIHIGADEAKRNEWYRCPHCQKRIEDEELSDRTALHGYFVSRMSDYLQEKGRTLVGWDEILESGAKPGAIGMYWRSGTADELVKKAASHGQFLVMSPTAHCYFDYWQSSARDGSEPGGYGKVITTGTTYQMKPVPDFIRDKNPGLILGVQGNLWGERLMTFPHALYQTYPRACALSEIAWSPEVEGRRDYEEFFGRLQSHFQRLDAAGIKYRQPNWADRPRLYK